MPDLPPDLSESLREGLSELPSRDPIFAECLAADRPLERVLGRRTPGFPALLRIILEQQVSTAAAESMWRRLESRLAAVTPDHFLALDDDALRGCGFSRQKAVYGRHLAGEIVAGRLDLDAVHALPDDAALAALTRLKGIGRWSAEIYLLLVLGRPDVWPADDLAIALGVQWLKRLERRPTRAELDALAEPWRPHRSTAARLVWHYYLATTDKPKRSQNG